MLSAKNLSVLLQGGTDIIAVSVSFIMSSSPAIGLGEGPCNTSSILLNYKLSYSCVPHMALSN